jgi:hypothetical protein
MEIYKMKNKLKEMYNEYFVNHAKELEEERNFSRPFLMNVKEDYIKSSKKVMIVGQETFGWYGTYEQFLNEKDSVEITQKIYDKFLENCSNDYNSPFWNFFNELKKVNSDASIIWNNVFKFETVDYLNTPEALNNKYGLSSLSKMKKYRYLIDKIKALQKDVFIKELDILKPDVVIFLTGHPYDSLFMDWQFKDISIFYQSIEEAENQGIDKWKLGQFRNDHLPLKTFRTYHPNYLRRSSKLSKVQKDFIFEFFKKQLI